MGDLACVENHVGCALSPLPRSMRIDTVHCMPEAWNKWHQRSAHILKLMMLWQSNKH